MTGSGRSRVLPWVPAALYMGLIWALSSIHITNLPLAGVPLKDKAIHFVEYAVLGFLVAHAVLRTWPSRARLRTFAVMLLITAGWGILDEMHQALVPGRSAELLDFLADTIGATAGGAVRFVLHGRFRRRPARA